MSTATEPDFGLGEKFLRRITLLLCGIGAGLGWMGLHTGMRRSEVEATVAGTKKFTERENAWPGTSCSLRAVHAGMQIELYFGDPGNDAQLTARGRR